MTLRKALLAATVGAIQAMKEAGLKPGKDVLTVSIDAVPDIFKAMNPTAGR
jgi:ABC-type sugar transport system substrate-binding protein